MVTTYHNQYPNRPSRSNSVSQNSLPNRLFALLPTELAIYLQSIIRAPSYTSLSMNSSRTPRFWRHAQGGWARRLLNLPHLFIAIWVVALLWGERWVFQSSIEQCRWEDWERWPADATPHHLVFLADPQLIDPHTYPGRPWPLSTATVKHTDNYLRRTYMTLQQKLHPDTLFFLGDLFDGGREWKTAHGNTEDPAWANGQRPSGEAKLVKTWGKRYGEDFWLKEYNRFGRIFFTLWNSAGDSPGKWQRGRKIISSLPGNHDLGFGANVKIPIRNRFETYFGEGNRVDVLGNHTFVSIDAVSLSAGGAPQDTRAITAPVQEFLSGIQAAKRKAVAREVRFQTGDNKDLRNDHKVVDLESADFKNRPSLDPGIEANTPDFPTILLTHVPLYRAPGTPCGPKREHWPPATPPKGQSTPVFPDNRNAISISKGWQYQNVLSEEDSISLVQKVGNVRHVFSGDDHDYCELSHNEAKKNVREITVKSMSYAMGVRKPGFQLLSLWNPLDAKGNPLQVSKDPLATMQSHLCLLPDQLGILIRYAILIAITISTLLIRAILMPKFNLVPFATSPYGPATSLKAESSLLPTQNTHHKRSAESSTSSTSSNNTSTLASRNNSSRTRGSSPSSSTNGYGLPSTAQAGYYSASDGPSQFEQELAEKYSDAYGDKQRQRRREPSGPDTVFKKVVREAWQSIWRTTWVVLIVFTYLGWFN